MVLVRRSLLVLFSLCVVFAVVFVGVYGYGLIRGSAASGVYAISVSKAVAEDVLFAAIVVASLTLIGAAAMIGRSFHLSRELDKIVEMSRYSDFSPETSLRRLGEIGERLNRVYRNANAVSESKSVKISALSQLNDFLVANLPMPVMIADVTGRIIATSRAIQERVEHNRNELLGVKFDEVVAETQWNEVESELLRRRTPVSRKTSYGEMSFYPIENRNGEVAYVVCSLEKPERLRMLEKTIEEGAARESSRNTGIRSILSGLRRQIGRSH